MADQKISQLPSADALDGSERIPLEQGGTTKHIPSDTFNKVQEAAHTITVGSAGDHATLTDALKAASRLRPLYEQDGVTVDVKLLSGFVMAEQVMLRNIDLGHATIIAEDATVTIDRSALTATNVDGKSAWSGRNSVFPIIGVLFDMDTSSTADSQNGFTLSASRITFRSGAGCQNATGRGLNTHHGSVVNGASTVFDNANIGVRCANGCLVYVEAVSTDGCGSRGIDANACYVDATSAVATNCQRGITADNGSVLIANSADTTGYTTSGIRSNSSWVDALAANAGAGAADDLVVLQGGTLTVSGATGGLSQQANRVTGDGVILDNTAPIAHVKSDRLTVPASRFRLAANTPTEGTVSKWQVWELADGAVDAVSANIDLDNLGWSSFNLYVWWTNLSTNSGDVVWRSDRDPYVGDGDTMDSPNTNIGPETAFTAGGQHVAVRSQLATGVTAPAAGELMALRVDRRGGDAADTLSGAAGLVAVELERAS